MHRRRPGCGFRRIVSMITVLAALSLPIGLQSDGAIAAQQAPNAREVNVELILDSSGSMAEEISPGETRIDAAKTVLVK